MCISAKSWQLTLLDSNESLVQRKISIVANVFCLFVNVLILQSGTGGWVLSVCYIRINKTGGLESDSMLEQDSDHLTYISNPVFH